MTTTEEKPDPIIFGDESMSDVTLVVDNQEFKSNKALLACHSTVFKAMFFGNFKESKEDRAEIKDVSVNCFRRLLEIIYTGKTSDPLEFLEFPMNGCQHFPISCGNFELSTVTSVSRHYCPSLTKFFRNKMSSTEEKPAPIIFDDKELSDVTLVVDNQDFIAHKLILACRSDVFKAMFYGDFKESKEDRVEIKDVSVQNFRRFLEIIYTGKVSDPRNFLEFPMRNNNEHDFCPIGIKRRGYFHNFWNDTTELLNIADRFNATPLVKGYFESIIITTMRICWKESCRQCLNTYIFAILNGMDLSECEKKYVLANYKDWITYATEKPFPDINNKTTNILFRYFV